MSLEAILRAITASGEAQVSQIEERARAQADEILRDARLEAEQIKARAFDAVVAPSTQERSRILQGAKLEALHITGAARETLVEATLEQARYRLAGMRSQPVYPQVLRRLTRQALAELELSFSCGESAYLEVDRRDLSLAEDILEEMKLNLPIQGNLTCWGGLVAMSEDGRVVVVNTLEARLERAIPYLRRYLAAFFEDVPCQISTSATPAYAP